jgi:hypothetical protein
MSPRKKSYTVAEAIAKMSRDPRVASAVRNTEARVKQVREEYIAAVSPIVADLQNAGYDIDRLMDLPDRYESYSEAVAILLPWLSKPLPLGVLKDITAVLATNCSLDENVVELLVGMLRQRAISWDSRGTSAIRYEQRRRVSQTLTLWAEDHALGAAREMIVLALASLGDGRSADALVVCSMTRRGRLSECNRVHRERKLSGSTRKRHLSKDFRRPASGGASRAS